MHTGGMRGSLLKPRLRSSKSNPSRDSHHHQPNERPGGRHNQGTYCFCASHSSFSDEAYQG